VHQEKLGFDVLERQEIETITFVEAADQPRKGPSESAAALVKH